MKHQFVSITLCMLVLALVGCRDKNQAHPPTYPPSEGDFVKNIDGRGTAQIWSIDFEVAETVGRTVASHFEGGLHSDPEKTNARVNITLGDDVKIRLEKIPGSPITLQFNNEDYGTVEVGDKVVIDKERNVSINGQVRRAL